MKVMKALFERPWVVSIIFMASALSATVAAVPLPAWAAITFASTNTAPSRIPLGQLTAVTVTAEFAGLQSRPVNAKLYRINANGTSTFLGGLNDQGNQGDAKAGDGIFTFVATFFEQTASTINLQINAQVSVSGGPVVRLVSPIFQVEAGGVLPPNTGGTIHGAGGTTITVPANALPFNAFVSIAAIDPSTISAPLDSNLPVVGAVKIIVEGSGFGSELGEPSAPLQISIPLPPGTPASGEFLVAQQIVFETVSLSGGNVVIGAASPQLRPVSFATAAGGNIVTQAGTFNGIRASGTYAIVKACCSGVATGTVSQSGVAQPGAVVGNDSNRLIDLADGNGNYTLFLSTAAGGNFNVFAFNPLRGSAGSATGAIATDGQTVTANLSLSVLSPAVNVRPGVRNAGFERRNAAGDCVDSGAGDGGLSGWEFTGAISVMRQFGPTAPFPAGNRDGPNGPLSVFVPANPGGVTILPTEGKCMAAIATGPITGSDDLGITGASLTQTITVPPGATKLRIDYNYVSEEFPEWIGSQFQDTFRVRVIPSNGNPVDVAVVHVDDAAASPGFAIIGDCGFPGGDDTCGQTGWQTVEADLSAFAGTNVTVQLLFDVNDVGDSIYTTMVLIDNIRFSTVWLDVKTINGASSQGLTDLATRVERDVLQANEVLSQAGINVRLRGVQSVANTSLLSIGVKSPHPLGTPATCSTPTGSIALGADGVALTNKLLITQATAAGVSPETTLLNTDRSGTAGGAAGGLATDVNIYYVRNAVDADTGASMGVLGWSANQGDFCQAVSIPADINFGTLVTDSGSTTTLTHELGHQLITAISDLPGTLLHACTSSEGTCFTVPGAPPTAIVTATQSQAINGSLLLKP